MLFVLLSMMRDRVRYDSSHTTIPTPAFQGRWTRKEIGGANAPSHILTGIEAEPSPSKALGLQLPPNIFQPFYGLAFLTQTAFHSFLVLSLRASTHFWHGIMILSIKVMGVGTFCYPFIQKILQN